jgi:diguanylate cyclase (GGDEF)-like protein/PAS domain S-box-containing protein
LLEPAIPYDEAKRLATLRGLNILDTPPEERFDRLTRLAQHLFDVPIVLVSLIDSNRQWFKSCQGLDASETPRNISFCGHAILNDHALIIPDASLDPRFADNPLVTGAPHIRFYAGQPLSASDGSRMGTLCIIDSKPHYMTQIERDSLRDLATMVENELNSLEIQQMATALLDSQNRLTSILDNVLDGIITINDRGIVDSFNKSAANIFGYSAQEVIGNNVNMLMPQPYKSGHDSYLHNYLTTHQPKVIGIGRKLHGRRKNGEVFPMYLAVTQVKILLGLQFIGLVRDATQAEEDRQLAIRQQAILSGANYSIIATDPSGLITDFNEAAERMLGYHADELIGKQTPAIIHDQAEVIAHAETLTKELGRLINSGFEVFVAKSTLGTPEEREWTYIRKDGTRLPVMLSVTALFNEDKTIFGYLGIAIDITERKQDEEEIKQSMSLLQATLESTADAILVVDLNNIWGLYNQQFIDLWHITDEIMAAKDDSAALSYVLNQIEDADGFLNKVRELYATPNAHSFDKLKLKDGRVIERFSIPQFIDREVVGRVWSFRDVTEQKKLEEQIRNLAFYDALTQLPNRRLLGDRLEQSIATSKRSGLYGALMFLDLDNFKPLNDRYGHIVGDSLLIEVAIRLKNCVREIDTVARFGGDEFVIMLNELDEDKVESTSQSRIVAEKICRSLAEPYQLTIKDNGKKDTSVEHHCTASVGVVLFDHHAGSQDDILKWADSAMYHAKEAGRNLIRFYDFKD